MSQLVSLSALVPGTVIEFDYPAHNLHNIPLEYVRRVVEVDHVSSFFNVPLSLDMILENPIVRRGSTMVFGVDLTIGERRKFYLEASRGARLPDFRIGIYDPDSPEDSVEWLGRRYRNQPRDWARMLWMLSRMVQHDFGHLRIGAFRVDSSLVGNDGATSSRARHDGR